MNVKIEKISDVTVVMVEGEVNLSNSMSLRASLKKLMDDGSRKISVDLLKVAFIDSSGLAVLIEAVQNLEPLKGQLRLCNVNANIRGIFEITKIHKLINIYENRELALKDF